MDELHTADQQAADDLFANYPTAAGVYDEMLGGGSVRRPYVNLSRAAAGFTADEMRSRSDRTAEELLDGLADRMDELQTTCREVTSAVFEQYFTVDSTGNWHRGSM